jgi:mannobiose 2-epimerase
MLYAFSLAHRLGFGGEGDHLLRAAELGYRFLAGTMVDGRHGGLVSVTEADGSVVDARKLLCGHSFAVYGLVEYHRASGHRPALELALQLFRLLDARLRDREHGGWIEHADQAFVPLRHTIPPARGLVGVAELKSADANLHWMEALAELYDATGDGAVGVALEEVLHRNRTCFFPPAAAVACPLRTRDWRPIGGSRYDLFSYGHAVEFAWLMIRAQQVLGVPPSWDHFRALVGGALRWGFDHRRGGVFLSGPGTGRATDRRKAWWSQAEALAAFADGWTERVPEYEEALTRLVDWILTYQELPGDRIWISVTDEVGRPIDRTKAGPWKSGYHDVRAMTKFIAAFS